MVRDPRLHWDQDEDLVYPPVDLPQGLAPHPTRLHLYHRIASRDGRGIRWRLRPEASGCRFPRLPSERPGAALDRSPLPRPSGVEPGKP